MTDAAVAARHNVRALLPGPEAALREAVLQLGAGPDALARVAQHGAVEALAVEGLSPDLTRVLERTLREGGGTVLSDVDGHRAVLLGPLMVMGQLPARLAAWSASAEALGSALGDVLMARGTAPAPLRVRDRLLRFDERTLVMGIVNVTPDSFSGDGLGGDPAAAAAQARRMVEAGADLIDVGAESTRPGAGAVDPDEEMRRLLPALAAIRATVEVPVSVDTRRAAVARSALGEGADLINDVWGLRGDPEMVEVAAAHPEVAVVVMHNQRGTEYADLLRDITAGLRDSMRIAVAHGVDTGRLIIDPGFGFAKTPAQNLELMRRLGELRGLGRPVLLGASRKHTIGAILGGAPPDQRVQGTLALLALAVAAGVSMVRVHDVADAARAVRVADAVVRGTPAEVAALPPPLPTG